MKAKRMIFDGKKKRDGILAKIQKDIKEGGRKAPHLVVLLIGDNPVCEKYVDLKKKIAQRTGLFFSVYKFDSKDEEVSVKECIEFLNQDDEVDGVMIQIPIDPKFDQKSLIEAISPQKDVDGLRYCLNLKTDFIPPVVLAVKESLDQSKCVLGDSSVVLIGHGFLVGAPLERFLKDKVKKLKVIKDAEKEKEAILEADIVISAVGKAGLVSADSVKDGAVLIDAGTAEVSGTLVGDIAPEAYKKAFFYTPVPGGIGPVTVAMLIKNLVKNEVDIA